MSSYKVLNLDSDEHVVMEVRKHWIVFAGYTMSLVFSAFLPMIFLVILDVFVPGFDNIVLTSNDSAFFLFIYSLWLLVLWLMFFVNWTKYHLDVWYVTEKRIIAIDQRQIFNRGISNLRFDKIQDVTIDVGGFVATFLNFGNVKVQTAGEDNFDFFMTHVSSPERVRQVIFSKHNEVGDKTINKIQT